VRQRPSSSSAPVQASFDLGAEACPEAAPARKAGGAQDAAATLPVLLPLPLDGPFDYAIAEVEGLVPGAYVEVPFGPRLQIGVVWDELPAKRADPKRLKSIIRKLDAPAMPPALMALVKQVAATTLHPLGAALRLALAVPAALEPPAPKIGLLPVAPLPEAVRLTAARSKVLALLEDSLPRLAAELARAAGVGSGVVHGMAKQGLLGPAPITEPAEPPLTIREGVVTLAPAQAEAAAALARKVGAGHSVSLLEGVPGAGKTEVYLEAVLETLRQGRQVLILLPEIALSNHILERLSRRFERPVAAWHSELTSTRRRRCWRRIAEGKEAVVVGARSALFLPFPELGLIVVDEEHDGSFKQEDGVPYQGRDMAIARARFEDCPVILSSATPALDTALAGGRVPGIEATVGRPPALLLPARHGGAAMPEIRLIDLRRDRPPRGGWLSPSLRQALQQTLEAGEQALLFLNRRGFAPLTICRACGHRLCCPNCSAWLVHHRMKRRLLCHHCGYARPEPDHCPDCGTLDTLTVSGPGVERLVDEVAAFLPEARAAIMTSDSPASPSAAAALLQAMRDHEIDLLIGTQIIAKGHHFPDLTLVGVVDGDLGLAGGDLRAGERQFQLLYQVAGRAGRAERPGRVMIQTHLPDHPVMQALAAGDKERFYAEELAERQDAGMPPFGRLAALVISGREPAEVRRFATELAAGAPSLPGLRILGPAPAPIAMLRGRHRQRLLAIAAEGVDLTAALAPWLKSVRPPGNLRLHIDVDPYTFL
jgi:primosomal protein N' (replication factor Y)